jgi:bifunctional enzyme CysN/CysC
MNHTPSASFSNVTRVEHRVASDMRRRQNAHAGGVIWFTGLSASGKSTLAIETESRLFAAGYQVYMLDGDNLRHGLNSDLGFSARDRVENIRRVGELAALFADAGMVVVCAFISPYRADRDLARKAAGTGFHEVHIKADLAICEARDVKGLYRRARAGEIPDFTGTSSTYEEPEFADLTIDTENRLEECSDTIFDYICESTKK